jgi:predicted flap endonuclease-1-like 5' DNA nuclease
MEFENLNIWCWSIPALVGIISGILGYLIGKGSNTSVPDNKELKLDQDKNGTLKTDLENSKKLSTGAAVPAENIAGSAAIKTAPFNAKLASAALGKTVKLDDLTIVEGIGPKIQELFHVAGIKTWKALSESSVARCQQILTDAGNRFKVHQPGSWPMQAKMAHEGKWSDLAKWQDQHKHGKL